MFLQGGSLKVSGTSAGKIEPGLNSFADSPADVAAYIVPLFEKASELVPVENHLSTKVGKNASREYRRAAHARGLA